LHFCLSVNDLFLTLDKGIVKYYIGDSSSLDFIELINYKIGTTPGCMSHHALRIVFMQRWTDPWSIGDIGILDNNQLANGPGISCERWYSRKRSNTQRRWSL
jgi:hypothetical protein